MKNRELIIIECGLVAYCISSVYDDFAIRMYHKGASNSKQDLIVLHVVATIGLTLLSPAELQVH